MAALIQDNMGFHLFFGLKTTYMTLSYDIVKIVHVTLTYSCNNVLFRNIYFTGKVQKVFFKS